MKEYLLWHSKMVQEEKYHEFHFTEQGLMEITRVSLFIWKCMEFHYISSQNPSCQEIYGWSVCARACMCDGERGVYPKKRVERERDEKLKEYTADLLSSCGNRRCFIHCSTSRRLNDISDLLEGRTVNI
jgi:hypothetical protein